MFEKFIIETDTNLFNELSNSINFEDVAKGRKGAVLVNCQNDLVPIVRTTSIYNHPAQKFLPIHYDIIEKIREVKNGVEFNNALIEIYDHIYRTMGFHTDQSLDLENNSYICIFSCYEDAPNNTDLRKLVIKNKTTGECSEILLDNNSIVLFTVETNHEYVHKIVLDSDLSKNKWLGITFRLSKTFVKIIDGVPYIQPSNSILRIANHNERNEFYKHKSKENLYTEFTYPEIDYTISKSDILPVV